MSAAAALSRTVIALGVIGCGRFGFEPTTDARTPDGADSAVDALGAFSTPAMILSTAGFDDDDPELSSDGLELYFTSDRPGGQGIGDVWRATRATSSDPWGTPALVPELNSNLEETQPTLCCGDLVMYLGSDRGGTIGNSDIWRSTRANVASPWSTPVHVAQLSAGGYDSAAIALDELEIILDTDRLDMATRHLFRAARGSTGAAWSASVTIAATLDQIEVDPSLATPLVLLYSGIRSDITVGYFDLYLTERAEIGGTFGPPQLIEGVNTVEAERDPWLSPDGRTIYFARENLAGDYDLFTATR